jgi:hypothetical protein
MKRILILVSLFVVLVGVSVALYFLFLAPHARLTVDNSGTSFGTNGALLPAGNNTAVATTGAGTVMGQNLVLITRNPVVAGTAVVDLTMSTTSTSTPPQSDVAVRYIDRQSGNVYEYRAIQRSLTRILNKTLPGIQEASWFADGSTAIVRYLETTGGVESISSYVLPVNGATGFFLQSNLSQALVLAPNSLFTLAINASGSVGGVAKSDGTGAKTVFTATLSSILVHQDGTALIASTKAAAEVGGYAFSISPSGVLTTILGPFRGLTVLPSPDGKSIVYSYTDGTDFHLSILDAGTGASTDLPLQTFAEKCVWASNSLSVYCAIPSSLEGTMPDNWYQGTVTLSDRIWRIDLSNRLATLVLDPHDSAKTDIDMVNLSIDPNQRVLVFRNKKDSSLWAYSL